MYICKYAPTVYILGCIGIVLGIGGARGGGSLGGSAEVSEEVHP